MNLRPWIGLVLAGMVLQGQPSGRSSITFVIGQDPSGTPPVLTTAVRHFREHPLERTDHVVTGVASLQELRDQLERRRDGARQAWGLVNLVVHADRQGAIDLPLTSDGPRVDETGLRKAPFPPLPDDVVDAGTEVRLHGCGVGRHPGLLRALSVALGGRDAERPLVRATPFYTSFQEGPDPRDGTVRQLCRVWTVTQPEGALEEGPNLERRFTGDPAIDVASALQRYRARWPGDTFRCDAEAVFTWNVMQKGGVRPELPESGAGLRAWLQRQDAFRMRLRQANFSLSDLAWTVTPTVLIREGRRYEAARVEGRGRVVHLLQVVEGSGVVPPEQAYADPNYYVAAQ